MAQRKRSIGKGVANRCPRSRAGPALVLDRQGLAASGAGPVAMRIFCDVDLPGDPVAVADYVAAALSRSRQAEPSLVVLGAGVGALSGVPDEGNASFRRAILTWARQFGASLPMPHPHVFVGVDGFSRSGDAVAQTLVSVASDNQLNVTWKSTPLGAEKHFLMSLRFQDGTLAPDVVTRNNHVFHLSEEFGVLSLICHDLTSFARTRWLPAQQSTSLFARVRQQFRRLLTRGEATRTAVSVWHAVPWPSIGRIPSSFLNGASHLEAGTIPVVRHGQIIDARIPRCRVVAVSRVPSSRGSEGDFAKLSALMPCHWPSIDVWMRPS